MKKVLFIVIAVALCMFICACDDSYDDNSSHESNDLSDTLDHGIITGTKDTEKSEETDASGDITSSEETEAPDDTTEEDTTDTEEDIPEETTPELIDGMRPDFKEAMDAYESFYNEYCDFMKEYDENSFDFTLIVKYGELLAKAEEMNEAFEEWDEEDMNDAEMKYYLEVNTRVSQKLLEIAG